MTGDVPIDEVVPKPTIEQVAWVFRHLRNHAKTGGSFRHLVYDRLGFDPTAYIPLYEAGGMFMSNELDAIAQRDRDIRIEDAVEEVLYPCSE